MTANLITQGALSAIRRGKRGIHVTLTPEAAAFHVGERYLYPGPLEATGTYTYGGNDAAGTHESETYVTTRFLNGEEGPMIGAGLLVALERTPLEDVTPKIGGSPDRWAVERKHGIGYFGPLWKKGKA